MILAWLIYDKKSALRNQSYIDWFIDEANKKGITLKLVLREDLLPGIKDGKRVVYLKKEEAILPQIAIVRTIDPLFSAHLESMKVQVFNASDVSRICNHKGWTHHEIQKLSIPMADTYFYNGNELPLLAPLDFPFVMKHVHGRGGSEVFFINSERDWELHRSNPAKEVILQSTDVQLGKDVRVYVIGKEIIAAILRENDQDFRANYTLGGTAKVYHLSEVERGYIHRICNHFDFDLVGIDFLIGENGGLLFNEIEDIVGSRTLSKLTNINLLEKYTDHILKKYQKKVEAPE